MADRARHIPNTPDTKYPVGGVSSSLSLLGALWLEEHGMLADQAPICHYIAGCPAAWKPITIHMLLDGSSGLPGFDTNTPGRTTAQSLRIMQNAPLAHAPGASVGYQNGEGLVLPLITEKVSGEPWATFIERTVLGPAGMTHSGRLTPASAPPTLAQSYSGTTLTPDATAVSTTSSFFAAYATAPDVYAYDNALFGGKLVSQHTLSRLFAPRALVPDPPTGFAHVRYGYWWRSGQVAGHRAIFTVRGATANLRFPQDRLTIAVISNDDQNDVGAIAAHMAALVFGRAVVTSVMPVHQVAPAKAITASYSGNVGTFPFAFADGAMWFSTQSQNGYLGTVTRIDTRTGRVVATINVSDPSQTQPERGEGAVVAANGQVWAVDSAAQTVVRIDPTTNKVAGTIHLGIPAAGLAASGDTLWATTDPALGNAIARVDLRTQKVVAVIKNAGHPDLETAASPHALWYISLDSLKVMRVDGATNKVLAAVSAGPRPVSLHVGAGSLWVWDHSGALLTRIDTQTNTVTATIAFPGYPGQPDCACQNVAIDGGAAWTIGGNSTLLRIDLRTNKVTAALTFSRQIANVGVSEGSVWVASDGGGSFQIDRVNPRAMK